MQTGQRVRVEIDGAARTGIFESNGPMADDCSVLLDPLDPLTPGRERRLLKVSAVTPEPEKTSP